MPRVITCTAPPMEATDCILQEIAAVGHHLEAMDAKISDVTVASTSIRADIAGFGETATNLDLCLSIVEDRVAVFPDQKAELRSLHAKVTDLEDRGRRDNVCFFGIPEYKEGSDIKTFLKNTLPEITGIQWSPSNLLISGSGEVEEMASRGHRGETKLLLRLPGRATMWDPLMGDDPP
ncbi:hypothetical protein NDU88_004868 [Pleurodeles waltl]|uniref:Uncharacterized protein n=1 Tax=Pleurodeles waltl TaxID=8319 RepID=A0AAV7UGE7_PLEWA|nr:hypothetical protein NDU88_004868 [Pleurodeles waltl]